MGLLADQMRQTLRQIAESDARTLRALDQHTKQTHALLSEMRDDVRALPATDPIQDAIELLEAHGYTVTR